MTIDTKCEQSLRRFIERLKHQDVVDPNILSIRDQLVNELGVEVNRDNAEINDLENELEALTSKKNLIKLPNKMKFKDVEEEIKRIRFDLAEKRKSISRKIKSHPTIKKNIQKMEKDRDLLLLLIELATKEFCLGNGFIELKEELQRQQGLYERNLLLRRELNSMVKLHNELSSSIEHEESNTEVREIRRKVKDITEKIVDLRILVSEESLQKLYSTSEKEELQQANIDFNKSEQLVKVEIDSLLQRISDEKTIHSNKRAKILKETTEVISRQITITDNGEKEVNRLKLEIRGLEAKRANILEILLVRLMLV